jgi:hypothetical protein
MTTSQPTIERDVDSRTAISSALLNPRAVLGLAGLYWILNVLWFWRYCWRNINADGISYIGIARNITDGNFRASLHGYWSPLVSWTMAATSFFSSNRTLAAHLLMLPLFVACLILLHRLTDNLWHSKLLSSLAVLWFATARGIAIFSISFIGADLLLTALVLVYFNQLLLCLEQPEIAPRWFRLGAAHGVAFLTKSIAMPLFAFTTALAVLLILKGDWKGSLKRLFCAAAIPIVIWASWGMALRTKYGVFTAGYQLHWNLIPPDIRAAQARGHELLELHDSRAIYDRHMVSDIMPPGSPLWQVKVWRASLLGQILRRELQNVPVAAKESFILLTPGGLLALTMCVVRLTRTRQVSTVRFHLAWLALATTGALVVAYCMLVFDGRYVIPVVAILIALAVGAFVPADRTHGDANRHVESWYRAHRWKTASALLLFLSLIGVQIYRGSPFRALQQDFQESAYDGASVLKDANAKTIVVVGAGPYPEHGVGWEAGLYSAYFAGAHVVGNTDYLPSPGHENFVIADIATLDPDAVMVWGTASNINYSSTITGIREAHHGSATRIVRDPERGEVGTVVILKNGPKDLPSPAS